FKFLCGARSCPKRNSRAVGGENNPPQQHRHQAPRLFQAPEKVAGCLRRSQRLVPGFYHREPRSGSMFSADNFPSKLSLKAAATVFERVDGENKGLRIFWVYAHIPPTFPQFARLSLVLDTKLHLKYAMVSDASIGDGYRVNAFAFSLSVCAIVALCASFQRGLAC
ncbi:hypothetical protein GOODEAATRI_029563, partial [Goodea atripinnis]